MASSLSHTESLPHRGPDHRPHFVYLAVLIFQLMFILFGRGWPFPPPPMHMVQTKLPLNLSQSSHLHPFTIEIGSPSGPTLRQPVLSESEHFARVIQGSILLPAELEAEPMLGTHLTVCLGVS